MSSGAIFSVRKVSRLLELIGETRKRHPMLPVKYRKNQKVRSPMGYLWRTGSPAKGQNPYGKMPWLMEGMQPI